MIAPPCHGNPPIRHDFTTIIETGDAKLRSCMWCGTLEVCVLVSGLVAYFVPWNRSEGT